MANHNSAIKRDRQNKKQRARNRQVRSTARTAAKKVQAITEPESAAEMLRTATKVIDKAASKGVLKKKTASRKISRLAKQVNKLSASA